MKFFPFIVFACLAGFASVLAQSQPSSPYVPSTLGVGPNLPSNLVFTSGTLSYVGGSSSPYGSGKYPHLQTALQALAEAEFFLGEANPTAKAEYLPRAIIGVQMATADVKWAIDDNDGGAIPVGALPSKLPAGVGNADSTENGGAYDASDDVFAQYGFSHDCFDNRDE